MSNFDLSNYQLEGELLDIVTFPAAVLKRKAEPVTLFNDELKRLCQNMLYTMYMAPGIGLAAPQIGKGIRLFVMDTQFQRDEVELPDGTFHDQLSNFHPEVFINPVISNEEGEILYEEGCLSVPGVYEEVKRHESITITYFDMDGAQHTNDAKDIYAICLQHEHDHLEGIVFLDRLSMLKQNILKKKFIKKKKKGLNG